MSDEVYPEDWKKVVLMVSPSGDINAIGGDKEPGEGDDMPYTGLERINKYWVKRETVGPATA